MPLISALKEVYAGGLSVSQPELETLSLKKKKIKSLK